MGYQKLAVLHCLDCFHRKRDISGIVMIVRVIFRKNKCFVYNNLVINGKIFLPNTIYKGGVIMTTNKQCMKERDIVTMSLLLVMT